MMEEKEIIGGDQVLDVFHRLRRNRTLVRMNRAEPPLTVLTLVVEVRHSADPPLFLVDRADGLARDLETSSPEAFDFEFNGAGGVLCRFRARGGRLASEGLWLPVPRRMERIQRRKDFRLTVLPGTRIRYATETTSGAIKVIDISLGGSLGALVHLRAGGRAGNFLNEGGILENLHLEVPLGSFSRSIRIKKARIRRVEKPPGAVRPRCALEFLEIGADQKKVLVETVYALQRVYLQNRNRQGA